HGLFRSRARGKSGRRPIDSLAGREYVLGPEWACQGDKEREMLLEGRVAIVSGIGPGLGRSVAWQFAREGAELVLGGIDRAAIEEVAAWHSGSARTCSSCGGGCRRSGWRTSTAGARRSEGQTRTRCGGSLRR